MEGRDIDLDAERARRAPGTRTLYDTWVCCGDQPNLTVHSHPLSLLFSFLEGPWECKGAHAVAGKKER